MEKALIAYIPLHAFQVIHNIIILENIGGKSVRLEKRDLMFAYILEKRKLEYRAEKQPRGF